MKLARQIWLVLCIFNLSAQMLCCAQSAATNLWVLQLANYVCDSSPALAPDGTIYQAAFDGKLVAVTPQGEIKWTFKSSLEIKSSPAIADDGTIYFGSRDRKFYAITPEGKLKWIFPTGAWIDSSPAIGADGTIYFGSWDTNFYALNPNGSKKWIFPTGGIIDSSPAIGADGTIYFGSHDKNFYALAPDGKLRWKFPTQGQIVSSPAINSYGAIIFTSTDGDLYALNPDGSEKWYLHTGGFTQSSPVLAKNGDIYVLVNACLFSFTSAGTNRWSWCSALDNDDSVAIADDGLIYFPKPWRTFDRDETRWRNSRAVGNGHAGQRHHQIVAISHRQGRHDLFPAADRYLYAITSTNRLAPLAKSSWPMFHANPQHTGRVQIVR